MESIYREVGLALDARLYYLAIAVTASIPDICASLEHGKTGWKPYKAWFRENVAHRFRFFNEHECYEIRCGVLHRGRSRGSKDGHSAYAAFFFSTMAGTGEMIVAHPGGGALSIDATHFCQTMIECAREWETKVAENAEVQANLANILRVRPEGFPPSIRGFPVIA
jgi:hypothetical protein